MPDILPLQHPEAHPTEASLVDRARPLRRGRGEVQFGTDPGEGMVLTGLTEAETSWLLSLGAGRSWTGRSASLPPGRGWGLDPHRVRHLLELLQAHGLLRPAAPAPVPTRGRLRVAVLGPGRLASRVRAQVRLSGAQHVESWLEDSRPDMAVLVAGEVLPGDEARSWALSGVPHLPVLTGPTRASVGPLVGAPEAPCLRCLDLTRRDHDPAWPGLLDQLSVRARAAGPAPLDHALAASVCGVVGILLQTRLVGRPVPAGVSWSIRLPSPQVVARRWAVHPRCETASHHPAR